MDIPSKGVLFTVVMLYGDVVMLYGDVAMLYGDVVMLYAVLPASEPII